MVRVAISSVINGKQYKVGDTIDGLSSSALANLIYIGTLSESPIASPAPVSMKPEGSKPQGGPINTEK